MPTMRYRLHTLMVALALGPLVLTLAWLHREDLPEGLCLISALFVALSAMFLWPFTFILGAAAAILDRLQSRRQPTKKPQPQTDVSGR